jgi:hypothetical protein
MTQAWFASPSPTAPYVKHRVYGPVALCGEYRQRWEPVEAFVIPGVFVPCSICLERGGTTTANHRVRRDNNSTTQQGEKKA